MAMDWFRWHHGSVTDPKFQLIASKAKVRLGDVITVWAFILEKASANQDRGYIGRIDFETLDFLLGGEEGMAGRILDEMTRRGLIDGSRVASWDERQPKREREDDSAAERKRQQRAREAEEKQVTPCHAESHQKKPRGEEIRVDESKPKSRDATASRLPADWFPSAEDVTFCETERPDLKAADVACRFRDYWIAQPGVKGRRTDWSATWRNWVRNEKAIAQPRASPPSYHDERKQTITALTTTGGTHEPASNERDITGQAERIA